MPIDWIGAGRLIATVAAIALAGGLILRAEKEPPAKPAYALAFAGGFLLAFALMVTFIPDTMRVKLLMGTLTGLFGGLAMVLRTARDWRMAQAAQEEERDD